jgi:hypothetical protein
VTARTRRRLHLCVFSIWLGPGAVACYYLKSSLPWVVFMSWYAIVATHLAAFSAETPVETEDES